jgi:hypothetical protein
MSKITQQRLHELFNYDAETGKFIRKISKKVQVISEFTLTELHIEHIDLLGFMFMDLCLE